MRRLEAIANRDLWQCRMPVCLKESDGEGRDVDRALLDDLNDPWAPSVDHVVPRSLGGSGQWSNLRLAHKKCNLAGAPELPRGYSRRLRNQARAQEAGQERRVRAMNAEWREHLRVARRGPQGGLLESPEDVLGGRYLMRDRDNAS